MNIISRRSFFNASFKAGLGVMLGTLIDVPMVVKRALAEGNIGLNGKKLMFIWLRGANDSLNSLIPVQDSAYASNRPNIKIPTDPGTNYSTVTGAMDFPKAGNTAGAYDAYPFAIRAGNGFTAIHPAMKFMADVYNAGDLAFLHRTGYVAQSRSHFDSQRYWENGQPNNNGDLRGMFNKTIAESGLAATRTLTGVSCQNTLPLIMRGTDVALTNIGDITRYNLLGIPNTTAGNNKFDPLLASGNNAKFTTKDQRQLLQSQYKNLSGSLAIFEGLVSDYNENPYRDNVVTDDDQDWATAWSGNSYTVDSKGRSHGPGYYLFPKSGSNFASGNTINGGWARDPGQSVTQFNKYVVDTGAYNSTNTGLFQSLLAACMVLNQTETIISGTEYGGFDTHDTQVTVGSPTLGNHANLMSRLGWAFYAIRKYFKIYGKGGTNALPGAQVSWDDLVVVTFSEFGRTTVENTTIGTDHAEAGCMFVAGGGVKGYNKAGNTNGTNHGIYAANTVHTGASAYNGQNVNWVTGNSGSMFAAGGNRYLGRAIDYRSSIGKIIRDHLGATQNQLNRIIPGYASESTEHLLSGGSTADGVTIAGEVKFI